MERHFKLTDETINHEGVTLHRIVATKPLEHARVAAGGNLTIVGNIHTFK